MRQTQRQTGSILLHNLVGLVGSVSTICAVCASAALSGCSASDKTVTTVLSVANTGDPVGSDSGYTLVQFSNSTYVNTTLADLSSQIGSDSQFLSRYNCDGSQENQLFTDSGKNNPDGTSLTAAASENQNITNTEAVVSDDSISSDAGPLTQFTIRHGVLRRADGSDPSNSTNPWVAGLERYLASLERIPQGKQLLDALEHAPYGVSIQKSGAAHFSPTEPGKPAGLGIGMAGALEYFKTLFISSELPFHQIGVGGVVFWDPRANYTRIESDGVSRAVDPVISLGHEMYHAYDAVRGLLDTRMVQGATYEMTAVAEYRAVFFEDQLRAALHVLPAKYYTVSDPARAQGVPSILDAHGQPRSIPSPCL